MKKLKVYNWELVKRWPIWYVFFISLMIFLVLYSAWHWSIMWTISIIFIFLVIIVWYVISYLISLKKTEITLEDWYFIIWWKTYSFDNILWFNVELDNNWNFTNFVLSTKDTNLPIKFKIDDSIENTKKFIQSTIETWLPLYNWYEQDKMYKIIKLLKL